MKAKSTVSFEEPFFHKSTIDKPECWSRPRGSRYSEPERGTFNQTAHPGCGVYLNGWRSAFYPQTSASHSLMVFYRVWRQHSQTQENLTSGGANDTRRITLWNVGTRGKTSDSHCCGKGRRVYKNLPSFFVLTRFLQKDLCHSVLSRDLLKKMILLNKVKTNI